MSVKVKNEFESLMRQQVYNDDEIMRRVEEHFNKKDYKNHDRFYDKLYNEFEEAYSQSIKNSNKFEKQNEDYSNLDEEEIESLDEEELNATVVDENGKEHTRRELLYKNLYRKNLKEYYNLRNRIHEEDVRKDESIYFNDKNFKDILKYEIYLKKIDSKFKAINGNYISKEFEDVNNELNEYVSEEDKYEKHINKNYEKKYLKIDELNEQLENISNKIELLNPNEDDYEEKYNALMDAYMEKVAKIHNLEPSILDLKKDEDLKKEQDDLISKRVSVKYQKEIRKASYDELNYKEDKIEKFKEKERGLYYKEDKTRNEKELEETVDSNMDIVVANIKAIREKLKNGDLDNLDVMIKDTKELISIHNIDRKALEKNIDSDDLDMIYNIDVDELNKLKEKNNLNNKDVVEKDADFAKELERVVKGSEISNRDIENSVNREIDNREKELGR